MGYLATELAYEGDVWEWKGKGAHAISRYRVIGPPVKTEDGRLNVPVQALHNPGEVGHCPDYAVGDWDEWHKKFTFVSRKSQRICPGCDREAQFSQVEVDYLCLDCRSAT